MTSAVQEWIRYCELNAGIQSSLAPLSNPQREQPTRGGGVVRRFVQLASNNRLSVVVGKLLISLSVGCEPSCCPWWLSVKSSTVMLPLPRSPSALLSHAPQKTAGGPAHLLLSITSGVWGYQKGRGHPSRDHSSFWTTVVSHSNKSVSVSLDHFCYQLRVA